MCLCVGWGGLYLVVYSDIIRWWQKSANTDYQIVTRIDVDFEWEE